ncbi:Cilia- and flagella-associated protein 57, partial [Rhizophlyctis rosea]
MSIPLLTPSHVFGFTPSLSSSLHHLDDTTLIYPTSTHLILYNTDNKSQRFVPIADSSTSSSSAQQSSSSSAADTSITAVAVSPAAGLVAIALRADGPGSGGGGGYGTGYGGPPAKGYGAPGGIGVGSGLVTNRTSVAGSTLGISGGYGGGGPPTQGTIVIVDLGNIKAKRKILSADVVGREFISLAFTPDGKNLVIQTGGPEWLLHFYSLEKSKLLATAKPPASPLPTDLHSMSVCPFPPSASSDPQAAQTGTKEVGVQICVTGNGVYRVYRFVEGQLKLSIGVKVDKNVLSHTWLSDSRLVLGTTDGRILLYDQSDLLLEHTLSFPTPPPTSSTTSATPPPSPSITALLAYSVGLLAGTNTGTVVLFEKTDDVNLIKRSKAFGTEDGISVIGMSMSPVEEACVVALGNNQIYNLSLDEDSVKGEEIKTHPLIQHFHTGAINGMDTCARKPLIATCGADRSVRIWNYAENTVEVMKVFHDEPLSIALHPSGLHVLVGFTDGLKLMNVLIDDIRPYWDANIRGCRECRFSNGGQYFASANGSTISLHNTWSFEVVGILKGHSGRVRSISWSSDDTRIVSCGLDGVCIDWNVRSLRKEGEIVAKGVVFGAAMWTMDMKLWYAVGSDGGIREIENGHIFREIPTKIQLTQAVLSRSGKTFTASTVRGTIRSFRFPFPVDQPGEYIEHTLHAGVVTRLALSYDDAYLFSAGEDGCLWVMRVAERGEVGRGGKGREGGAAWSDEILVTRSDLKSNVKVMHELKQRVEQLKSDNEMQLKMKDMSHAGKIQEMTEKYMAEIEGLKQLTTNMKKDREGNRLLHQDRMKSITQANKDEIKEVQTSFTRRMEEEQRKHASLQARMAELKDKWVRQVEEVEREHRKKVEEVEKYYRGKTREKEEEVGKLKSTFTSLQQSHTQALIDISQDTDHEVLHLQHSFEVALRKERDSLASIKEENQTMLVRHTSLTRQIDEQKEAGNKMEREDRRLSSIIKGLERDIVGVRREMQERDETIQDKEKRIYDLKKKNQELEKFKFVLDYKIMELKKQVEPRERDIISLSNQIQDMDQELHQYHQQHDELENAIRDLAMKLRAAKNEEEMEAWREREVRGVLMKIRSGVEEVWRERQEGGLADSKRTLVSLHHKFLTLPTTPPHPPSELRTQLSASPTSLSTLLRPTSKSSSPDDDISHHKNVEAPLEEAVQAFAKREHLEHTVSVLQHRLREEGEKRYIENVRIVRENGILLRELNTLRKDLHASNMRAARLTEISRTGKIEPGDEEFLRSLAAKEGVKKFRS